MFPTLGTVPSPGPTASLSIFPTPRLDGATGLRTEATCAPVTFRKAEEDAHLRSKSPEPVESKRVLKIERRPGQVPSWVLSIPQLEREFDLGTGHRKPILPFTFLTPWSPRGRNKQPVVGNASGVACFRCRSGSQFDDSLVGTGARSGEWN